MQNITAIEWLVNQINSDQYQKAFGQTYISIELIEQAKAMEKKQIEDAYIMGSYDMADKKFNPSEYYNEIYERKPNL